MVAFARQNTPAPRQPSQWTLADIIKKSSEILYPMLVRLCVPQSHGRIDLEFSFQDGCLNHIRVGDEDLFPLIVELDEDDTDVADESMATPPDDDRYGNLEDDASDDEDEDRKLSTVPNTLKDMLGILKLKLQASMIRDFFGTVTLALEIEDGICGSVSCKSSRIHKVASAKIP